MAGRTNSRVVLCPPPTHPWHTRSNSTPPAQIHKLIKAESTVFLALTDFSKNFLFLKLVFLWYKEEAFAHHEGTAAVVLIMMLYGWAAIPFVYTVSFSFKNPGNACAKLVVMLTFLSICPTVLVTVTSDKGEITSRSCINPGSNNPGRYTLRNVCLPTKDP